MKRLIKGLFGFGVVGLEVGGVKILLKILVLGVIDFFVFLLEEDLLIFLGIIGDGEELGVCGGMFLFFG
ncbi:hypothetical protein BGC29_19540 [Acinetobacter baumannii]|nr:hypothetical protein BGC29_19540 [Acinetobacter baumannii]